MPPGRRPRISPNLPSRLLPRLYAIVDVELCASAKRAPTDVAQAFLAAGVTCLQLRAKTWDSGPFLALAREVIEAARATRSVVVINDRADIAALSDASGVHVGQEDLPPSDVRRIVGASAIVGRSTHTEAQLEAAIAEPISYVAVGPVFETGTKDTGYRAIGLDSVRKAATIARRRSLPLVAIGGITLENAPAVIASGADSVAIISDLLVGDPERRARALIDALR